MKKFIADAGIGLISIIVIIGTIWGVNQMPKQGWLDILIGAFFILGVFFLKAFGWMVKNIFIPFIFPKIKKKRDQAIMDKIREEVVEWRKRNETTTN